MSTTAPTRTGQPSRGPLTDLLTGGGRARRVLWLLVGLWLLFSLVTMQDYTFETVAVWASSPIPALGLMLFVALACTDEDVPQRKKGPWQALCAEVKSPTVTTTGETERGLLS